MKDLGIDLDKVTIAELGQAKKVEIDSDNTTLIEGAGKTEAIKARIEQIRKEIATTTSDYDKEKLQERLAKLAGGVAQINVGAATESEMKEKKARVEDALHATRAAVEEGILPGGGVALLRSLSVLGNVETDSADEKTGVEIVRRALQEPTRCIVENAGEEGAVIVKKILAGKGNFGFNALSLDYEQDMVKAGIITPTKVERTALQNASSVATLLLTTDAIIVEKPKSKDASGPGGPGGMGGGMDGMGGMGGGMGGMGGMM